MYPIVGLQVDSDLQLDIDGVPARVVSRGTTTTVSTPDAGRLLARVLDTAPGTGRSVRAAVAAVAAQLDAAGLTARIVDDRGTVAALGRGCGSATGRLLFGDAHVQLGPVALPAAGLVLRTSAAARRRLAYSAGAVAVAALVVGAGRHRAAGRRSPR